MKPIQTIPDLQNAVVNLDNKAKKIHRRFFLFDDYYPSRIPPWGKKKNIKGIDEIRFHYLILELYKFFHDCGAYLTNNPHRLQCSFSPLSSSSPPKTMFSLPWNGNNREVLQDFRKAIEVVRTVYCHNVGGIAPSDIAFITKSNIDNLCADWHEMVSGIQDITKVSTNKPLPFDLFFEAFLSAAQKALEIIDTDLLQTFVKHKQSNTDKSVFRDWFMPVYLFYLDIPGEPYKKTVKNYQKIYAPNAKPLHTCSFCFKDLFNNYIHKEDEYYIFFYAYNMYKKHFSITNLNMKSNQYNLSALSLFKPLLDIISLLGNNSSSDFVREMNNKGLFNGPDSADSDWGLP